MKRLAILAAGLAVVALTGPAQAKKCPQDAVLVGHLCVDKYEASAWETSDAATVKNIKKGKVDAASDLALATQRGLLRRAMLDDGLRMLGLFAVANRRREKRETLADANRQLEIPVRPRLRRASGCGRGSMCVVAPANTCSAWTAPGRRCATR